MLAVFKYKIHCIGHSLGAHACGFSGKLVKLGRISGISKKNFLGKDVYFKLFIFFLGLDPAGPEFRGVNITERLDRTDAEFVFKLKNLTVNVLLLVLDLLI